MIITWKLNMKMDNLLQTYTIYTQPRTQLRRTTTTKMPQQPINFATWFRMSSQRKYLESFRLIFYLFFVCYTLSQFSHVSDFRGKLVLLCWRQNGKHPLTWYGWENNGTKLFNRNSLKKQDAKLLLGWLLVCVTSMIWWTSIPTKICIHIFVFFCNFGSDLKSTFDLACFPRWMVRFRVVSTQLFSQALHSFCSYLFSSLFCSIYSSIFFA